MSIDNLKYIGSTVLEEIWQMLENINLLSFWFQILKCNRNVHTIDKNSNLVANIIRNERKSLKGRNCKILRGKIIENETSYVSTGVNMLGWSNLTRHKLTWKYLRLEVRHNSLLEATHPPSAPPHHKLLIFSRPTRWMKFGLLGHNSYLTTLT